MIERIIKLFFTTIRIFKVEKIILDTFLSFSYI